MKKVKIIILAVVVSILLPVSAFANTDAENEHIPDGVSIQPFGAGEWDYVTLYEGDLTPGWYSEQGKQYKSYGGNFKIDAQAVKANNCFKVQLMEYDPNNPDDKIGKVRSMCGEGEIVWDVRDAVDGNNGAELYLSYGEADISEPVYFVGYD